MAEVFLGKWQVDLSSISGLDEFGSAFGMAPEMVEMLRKLSYTIEFTSSGDIFTATLTFASDAVPVQTYSFKLGESFVFNDIDGTKPKLIITLDGGKFVERYNLEENSKEWMTVRDVAGNVMTSVTTYAGKSVSQKLNKQ